MYRDPNQGYGPGYPRNLLEDTDLDPFGGPPNNMPPGPAPRPPSMDPPVVAPFPPTPWAPPGTPDWGTPGRPGGPVYNPPVPPDFGRAPPPWWWTPPERPQPAPPPAGGPGANPTPPPTPAPPRAPAPPPWAPPVQPPAPAPGFQPGYLQTAGSGQPVQAQGQSAPQYFEGPHGSGDPRMGGYVPVGGTYPDGHVNDGTNQNQHKGENGGAIPGSPPGYYQPAPVPTRQTAAVMYGQTQQPWLADGSGGYGPQPAPGYDGGADNDWMKYFPADGNGGYLPEPTGGVQYPDHNVYPGAQPTSQPTNQPVAAGGTGAPPWWNTLVGGDTGGGGSQSGQNPATTGGFPDIGPITYDPGISVGTMGTPTQWMDASQQGVNLGMAQAAHSRAGQQGVPTDMANAMNASASSFGNQAAGESGLAKAQPVTDMTNNQQLARAQSGVQFADSIISEYTNQLSDWARRNLAQSGFVSGIIRNAGA
jgi:hypothetical protein